MGDNTAVNICQKCGFFLKIKNKIKQNGERERESESEAPLYAFFLQ